MSRSSSRQHLRRRPPYWYSWQRRQCTTPEPLAASDAESVSSPEPDDLLAAPPTCTWTSAGSTPSIQITSTADYDLRVTVTDATEASVTSPVHAVNVEPMCVQGAPSASDSAEAALAETSVLYVEALPTEYALHGGRPNPFSHTAQIAYDLPEAAHVTLTLYNVLGQAVAQVVNEAQGAGFYEISFDGSRLSTGVYILMMKAGDFRSTRRMVLVK